MFRDHEAETIDLARIVSEAERRLEPPFDATDTALFRKLLDAGLSHEEAERVAAEFMSATPVERAA